MSNFKILLRSGLDTSKIAVEALQKDIDTIATNLKGIKIEFLLKIQ